VQDGVGHQFGGKESGRVAHLLCSAASSATTKRRA
jgi:hypothetical protein